MCEYWGKGSERGGRGCVYLKVVGNPTRVGLRVSGGMGSERFGRGGVLRELGVSGIWALSDMEGV